MAVFYVILLVVSLLFFILYEGYISMLIFGFALLLPILFLIMDLIAKQMIYISMNIETKTCSPNQSVPITISIKNRSVIPVPCAEITLEYSVGLDSRPEKLKISTPIFPLNDQQLKADFSSAHFGIIKCSIAKVKLFDMLRITRLRLSKKHISGNDNTVLVIPEPLELSNPVSRYSDQGLDSDVFSPDKPGNDPSEIYSIHEYADGDKLSRVHWKLTAKQDKVMVKDYSLPVADACMILCDTYTDRSSSGESSKLYDTAIELAVSLSALLNESEVRHCMSAYDSKTDTLGTFPIYDEQSLLDASAQLLISVPPRRPEDCIRALSSLTEENKHYVHLMYITSRLTPAEVSLLSTCGLANRYTILLCRTAADINYDIPDTDINIIPVYAGMTASSVSELVL